MKRAARLARMEVRTAEPFSPWQNKAESVIIIFEGKAKRRRVQSNIPKRVCDFVIVLESEIYSRTAGKYGCPYLERLTGYRIYISEWMEFGFYDLV